MDIEYTGRQVKVTGVHRAIGDEGIGRIAKVLGKITTAHIVLTAEKYRQTAEVTVTTRLHSIVGLCESTSMDTALREALVKAETQAIRHKEKFLAKKRKVKDEKDPGEVELARTHQPRRIPPAKAATAVAPPRAANGNGNGNGRSKPPVPVTIQASAARKTITEPHVVRSIDSLALRPMTLEEAVKEAEFHDKEVFVYRDRRGELKVLHRKRDGQMELIEIPA